MIRDESFHNIWISEDRSSFDGGETCCSCKSTEIKILHKDSKSFKINPYNIKKGQKSNFEEKKLNFEKIVLPHLNFLKNMSLKLTNNPNDAEDLLQETLLRAFRFFDRFEPDSHPKAWLYKIMKNTHINNYRKFLKSQENFGEDVEDLNIKRNINIVRNMDPQKAVLNKELFLKLKQIVKEMPSEFREVFILGIIEGYSYKEIAKIIGCPLGTVMSRIHRARKILKKELIDYYSEQYSEPLYNSINEDYETNSEYEFL